MTDTLPATRRAVRHRSGERVSVVRMIAAGLSWALLVIVALIAIVVIAVPAVTGSRAYTVLTGSMVPLYPPGTLVVVRPVDPSTLRTGDVVTYQLESGKPAVVTHRIVGIGASGDGAPLFLTRGDANNVDDAKPVLAAQVVGKLWYAVPYIGWINNILVGDWRMWVIPIVVGALLLYGVVTLISAHRDRRRARAAADRGTRRVH
ncbi:MULTISPECIES: signal peptidase I [Microbacterium]|uniref:signal peptidase I n=1 Tax=Microbacterium TaxID=33882 RepID=UPI001484F45E|nr:signal peptidase I [Microbacterium sp. 4NA327F11]MBN9208044.1 signal peptidase I [Microbacterium ginsengisoli]MCK9913383.1 signal peptidase I [Microbacteriaceae bacterium K1510]